MPPIAAGTRAGTLPLSFAQQRLWFLEQLAPGAGTLNLAFALRLTGNLNTQALRRSFELLTARHEVLRTAFVSVGGMPELRIGAPQRFELPQTDARDLSRSQIEQRIRQSAQRGFDLNSAPLLIAGPNEAYLSIALHHIVADGWSLALLVDELASAYQALRNGEETNVESPVLQYADYAQWQRRHLSGAAWEQQLAYWRAQLGNAPAPLALPGAAANASREGGRHRGALPADLARALHLFAEQNNASPFMVMYAALNVTLHQQTGSSDLVIGTDVANRHRRETEGMVGFFVNQLVLRCRLERTAAVSR
jgi:hypothetical protein